MECYRHHVLETISMSKQQTGSVYFSVLMELLGFCRKNILFSNRRECHHHLHTLADTLATTFKTSALQFEEGNLLPIKCDSSPQTGITILLEFSHIKYASQDGHFQGGQVASSPKIWGIAHQLSNDNHIWRVYDTLEK